MGLLIERDAKMNEKFVENLGWKETKLLPEERIAMANSDVEVAWAETASRIEHATLRYAEAIHQVALRDIVNAHGEVDRVKEKVLAQLRAREDT
jgi:hypothetical protein